VTLHEAVAGKKLVPPPEPLPEPVIDAHTHLDACGVDTPEQVAAAMHRAASVGVAAVVTVGGDMPSNRWSVTAAGARDDLFAAVAVHPTEALTLTDAARAELESLAAHPAVVAVGETGLDFYWDSAPREAQAEAFAWHIDLAKRVGKPLMIHDRLAHDAVLDILHAEGAPETVIFHCFSGDEAMARICAGHGYVMSFAGPVSFTNAPELVRAAAVAPLELIMVETDAPFLTPHPHRGRRNEPFALPYTVRSLAGIRQMPLAELCSAVRINTERTYRISVSDS
jgi:TatD DNase family protein